MEGRKEEYHGHDPTSQTAFQNTPYFESLLQGISISTSAANTSGVSNDSFQSWGSSAFTNPYPSYSNWTGHTFNDIFPADTFPADTSRHAFNIASGGGGIASNVPVYDEFFSTDLGLDTTDISNTLTSPFTGFGGLDFNEFRNVSDANLESSTESVTRQQNYVTKTYDPFGTVPVFSRDSEGTDTTDHSPTLGRSSSPSLCKPTYSDVAKNKPKLSASASSSKSSEPKSVPELVTPTSYLKVPYKKSKPNRGHLNKPKHAADSSVVKPDSKYGLDSFEEPSKILMDRTKRQHSLSGSDSMPPSRKGSTSSLGSASSGMDEFFVKGGASNTTASPEIERKAQESKAKKSSFTDSEAKKNDCKKKSKKAAASESTKKEETIFFDPKLIFQSKPKAPHKMPDTVPNNQQQGGSMAWSELLNNGKPKSNLCNSNFDKSSSTHYINNDLGQCKKQTNMNTHRVGQDNSKTSNMDSRESSCAPSGPSSDAPDNANIFRRKFDFSQGRKPDSKPPNPSSSKKSKKSKDEPNALGELATLTCEWTQWLFKELFHILQNVVLLIFKCAVLLCLLLGQYILDLFLSFWNFVKSRFPRFRNGSKEEDWSNSSSQSRLKSPQGLEENITLPTTGEEAMKRLLACKGKDPFSILGVKIDSSDEQIKRYYRKQAVLVHPDKNQQPGAEEAFKILGHAFELIGEPEKRQKYREARETEAAMQEFADLLSKLHDKMQEAANTMRCDNCGGKHTRVPTDRPFYSARFCDRCNTRHAAKEGDVWAESSVLGFLWHYYACMEGKIYDITEWASCQNTHFKHIQANAHQVIYRIATSANRRHNATRTNEADLEDFFNHLFQRGQRPEGDKPEGFNYGAGATTQQQNPPSAGAWNTAGRQQKKKKKKRH